jgi:hypothetical protein
MLRYAYLRSDFHPQILILGERDDFQQLAADLRAFAAGDLDGKTLARHQPTAPDTAATLVLTRETPPRGARASGCDQNRFHWGLNATVAQEYADLVDRLAIGADAAGSAILETGAPDEVPVKVSLGEFTDDFLLSIS